MSSDFYNFHMSGVVRNSYYDQVVWGIRAENTSIGAAFGSRLRHHFDDLDEVYKKRKNGKAGASADTTQVAPFPVRLSKAYSKAKSHVGTAHAAGGVWILFFLRNDVVAGIFLIAGDNSKIVPVAK